MGLAEWFGFGWGNEVPITELPNIFPLGFEKPLFIQIDVQAIYNKILTDVIERTHGLSEDQEALLWDNCLKSESSDGLITMLSHAMTLRQELFLVYEAPLNVIRKATGAEMQQIRADYAKIGKSNLGVYISFERYRKSQLVALYSALEYVTLNSLHKAMNLSAATQIKMNDLRASTSLTDSADVKSQAQKVAQSLANGRDVLLDAKDIIENAMPDLTAINQSIEYLSEKRSFYLGLPACYITGEQTTGMGTTGESDTKAIERGLKNYYLSIIKPALKALFDVDTSYKSQDFRQIEEAMDVLKTFSLTDDTLISHDNKLLILNRLLDLPEDAEGDEPIEPVLPAALPVAGTQPKVPAKEPVTP